MIQRIRDNHADNSSGPTESSTDFEPKALAAKAGLVLERTAKLQVAKSFDIEAAVNASCKPKGHGAHARILVGQ